VTALVVNDDRHVRSYLRMLLRGAGVETVAEAIDTAAAIELYRAFRPSVVLLDVDLPGVTIAEAVQPLRNVDPEVAVIAVTARTEQTFVASLARPELLGYIPIHVLREEIAQRISSAIVFLRPNTMTPCRMTA
jgi:DNA-binding NarL/FixJ family response regulator